MMYKYFFEILLSIILSIYPVEILDQMIILFLIVLGTAILVFTVTIPFFLFPQMAHKGCYPHQHLSSWGWGRGVWMVVILMSLR